MWLFLAFLAVPLIEIALFIEIGGAIGLGWTLAIVVLTAVLGTWLVRNQGLMAMGQLRSSFSQLHDPTEPLANGAMILFAGALLLTPGFFTDAVGFALLTPPVRAAIYRYLRARVTVHSFDIGDGNPSPRHSREQHGDIIDGEFEEVQAEPNPNGTNTKPNLTKD